MQYNLNFDEGRLISSDGYCVAICRGNRRTCIEIMEPVPDAQYFVTLGGITEKIDGWHEAYKWLEMGLAVAEYEPPISF